MNNRNCTKAEITKLFALPFMDLLYQAQTIHRAHFNANEIQLSSLLSIKTGLCPEDCAYCPQSAHYQTGLKNHRLLDIATIVEQAKAAKAQGATRFCMGAAWRSLPDKELQQIIAIIKAVKALDLEACMTLGMLTAQQAKALADAGLDYYNHNLDTSEEFYEKIISTRSYQQRLDTLEAINKAGMQTCCGGIMGLGEQQQDRISFLYALANLPQPPKSVPINLLQKIPGTPLAETADLDLFEFVRVIAVARIILPTSFIRLSAGRKNMSDTMQALCFLAGANSIFVGEKLLTSDNPAHQQDQQLLSRLNLTTMSCNT